MPADLVCRHYKTSTTCEDCSLQIGLQRGRDITLPGARTVPEPVRAKVDSVIDVPQTDPPRQVFIAAGDRVPCRLLGLDVLPARHLLDN